MPLEIDSLEEDWEYLQPKLESSARKVLRYDTFRSSRTKFCVFKPARPNAVML